MKGRRDGVNCLVLSTTRQQELPARVPALFILHLVLPESDPWLAFVFDLVDPVLSPFPEVIRVSSQICSYPGQSTIISGCLIVELNTNPRSFELKSRFVRTRGEEESGCKLEGLS